MKIPFAYGALALLSAMSACSAQRDRSATPQDMRRELFLAREKVVSKCMRKNGFRYVAKSFESSIGPVQKLYSGSSDAQIRELRKRIGFGISTGREIDKVLRERGIPMTSNDPNESLQDGLTSLERVNFRTIQKTCFDLAQSETAHLQAKADAVAVGEIRKLTKAAGKWTKCMALRGYPSFSSPLTVMQAVNQQYTSQGRPPDFSRREGEIALADYECTVATRKGT